jgi:hypothetical protein
MDQPGLHTANLIRGYRGADAAAAERDSALDLSCGNCLCQWDDEIGVVIERIKLERAEINNLVPRVQQRLFQ